MLCIQKTIIGSLALLTLCGTVYAGINLNLSSPIEKQKRTIDKLNIMTRGLRAWVEKVLSKNINRDVWEDTYKEQALLWENRFSEVIDGSTDGYYLELRDGVYQRVATALWALSRGKGDIANQEIDRMEETLNKMSSMGATVVCSAQRVME